MAGYFVDVVSGCESVVVVAGCVHDAAGEVRPYVQPRLGTAALQAQGLRQASRIPIREVESDYCLLALIIDIIYGAGQGGEAHAQKSSYTQMFRV